MTTTAKQQVSSEEFQKKVEIESANLQHFEHMKKKEADKKAEEIIKDLYEVV